MAPPTLVLGTGDPADPRLKLKLLQGTTATITNAQLQVVGPGQTDSQLVYTVQTATTHGVLRRNGSIISAGGTFTQADINNSAITYSQDGTPNNDSFTFSVGDAFGRTIGPFAFAITTLSVQEVGTEFQANAYTPEDQTLPAVATDPAGDVVVAWRSILQDGDQGGIYAQRFGVGDATLPNEVEPNGSAATANVATGNLTALVSSNLYQLGIKGTVSPGTDVDW